LFFVAADFVIFGVQFIQEQRLDNFEDIGFRIELDDALIGGKRTQKLGNKWIPFYNANLYPSF
jgi:hypothetical protein